jgi:DNA (cytosine-5)-methyltransferase 1
MVSRLGPQELSGSAARHVALESDAQCVIVTRGQQAHGKRARERCWVPALSSRPIAVDLFAGAGGLSLGLEQAGFDVAAAVEYDPTPALVHRFNFPDCEVICRDVRYIEPADVVAAARVGAARMGRPMAEDTLIDLVAGGPSCQGFSTGGRREVNDDRNDLLLEFVRLVVGIRPRTFLLENVPGLLEPRFDELRERVFKSLRNAGYALSGTSSWLNANDYGVAQVRKRVIVTGVLEGPPADRPNSVETGLTVRQALAGLPAIESYEELLHGDSVQLRAVDLAMRQTTDGYAGALTGATGESTLSRPRIWPVDLLTCSRRTVHSPATIERFGDVSEGRVEPISRLFRLAWDRPARTLRAGTGRERGAHTSPRPIHPALPRVITVREAARLHGYPDWFRFGVTKWHGHRQVGNSVPPPLAHAVAQALIRALGARPAKLRRAVQLGDEAWLAARPSLAASLSGARQAELPPQRQRKVGPPASDALGTTPAAEVAFDR